MSPSYICPSHPDLGTQDYYCPECVAKLARAPVASSMTPSERAAELKSFSEIVTVPWVSLVKRAEELLGRGIWTHEFALFDELVAEAESGIPEEFPVGTMMEKALRIIPPETEIIVVNLEEDE